MIHVISKYMEKIPYPVISKYHCDDIQWDETKGEYALLDIDPWYDDCGACHIGYIVKGYASYEEIQCEIQQWEDKITAEDVILYRKYWEELYL